MANRQMTRVVEQLRNAVLQREGSDLTDAQLLECFVNRHEQAALEILVRRHSPMVWGVCQRILGRHHDAEDAFQAAFLVLVRKAAAIHPGTKVANWLYGVARQTALKARAIRAKRRARETSMTDMREPAVTELDSLSDLQALLDQEMGRLPEKYRTIVVLCELEGKTVKEAAHQLGLAQGTAASRLARARQKLAKRLARHGLAVTAATFTGVLAQQAASAAVPASVMCSTIKAATLVAAGQAASAEVISVNVATLTDGVLKLMLLNKLKTGAALLLVLSMFAFGGGLLTRHLAAAPEDQDEKPAASNKKTEADGPGVGVGERDKVERDAYEDYAQFACGLGGVGGNLATGTRDRGGYNVLVVKSAAEASTLSLSFALREDDIDGSSDYRLVAVDDTGKRHEGMGVGGVAAGSRGLVVATFSFEFDLPSSDIKSLIVQRRIKAAPDTEGTTLDGKRIKLTDFRGKVILLVFWNSLCKPCMTNVPHLQELLRTYAGRPFTVVGVNSGEGKKRTAAVITRYGMTWPSIYDGEDGPIVEQWNVTEIPTVYLIDAKGMIRLKNPADRDELDKAIKVLDPRNS